MEQDSQETVVVFRVWKKLGDVIALFPAIDEGKGFCSSYEYIGQHGGAHYQGVILATKPALPEEYADLKEELEKMGYRLKVQRKYTRKAVI